MAVQDLTSVLICAILWYVELLLHRFLRGWCNFVFASCIAGPVYNKNEGARCLRRIQICHQLPLPWVHQHRGI